MALKTRTVALALAPALSMLTPFPLLAQDSTPQSDGMALDEIVVTAQKRAEPLQQAPLAVSAVTSETIAARGIVDVGSLSSIAPNLTISQAAASSTTAFVFIRGIGESEPILTADAPNAIYVDGVVLGRSTGSIFDLVDLERIEVLRGPQGTLYGRNTTGGAINLITKRPAKEFGVQQQFTYGRFDLMQSRTTIDTGEFGDSGVQAKFSYIHKQRDGYVDNVVARSKDDPGSYNVDALRAALSYDKDGPFRAYYVFDFNDRESRPIPTQMLAAAPYLAAYLDASPALGGAAPQISRSRLSKLNLDHDGLNTDRTYGHMLTLEADLGADTLLRSISSYRKWKNVEQDYDLDGNGGLVGFTVDPAILVPPDFEFIPVGVGPISLYDGFDARQQHQYSQEINLIGKIGTRFDYVLGAFYFKEKAQEIDAGNYVLVLESPVPIELTPDVSVPAFGVPISSTTAYRHRSESEALFGQGTYAITDQFSLTGGLRYTWDKKHLVQSSPILRDSSAKFGELTWMVNAKYQFTTDMLAYARIATGYKSGGFNARNSEAVPAYDPETVTSYEIGLKSEFFNRRVRLNLAGFYMDYKDLQVSQFVPGSGGVASVTENAGKASYAGLEAEIEARLARGLTVSGNIGYVDRKYKEYLFVDPAAGPTDPPIDVADEARFAYSAPVTANAGIEYVFPAFDFGELSARVDYTYRGRIYFHQLDRLAPFNTFISDGPVSTFDGRVALSDIKLGGADLTLALWGKNLTNEKYLISAIDFGPLGFATGSFAEPRSWGIDLSARF